MTETWHRIFFFFSDSSTAHYDKGRVGFLADIGKAGIGVSGRGLRSD